MQAFLASDVVYPQRVGAAHQGRARRATTSTGQQIAGSQLPARPRVARRPRPSAAQPRRAARAPRAPAAAGRPRPACTATASTASAVGDTTLQPEAPGVVNRIPACANARRSRSSSPTRARTTRPTSRSRVEVSRRRASRSRATKTVDQTKAGRRATGRTSRSAQAPPTGHAVDADRRRSPRSPARRTPTTTRRRTPSSSRAEPRRAAAQRPRAILRRRGRPHLAPPGSSRWPLARWRSSRCSAASCSCARCAALRADQRVVLGGSGARGPRRATPPSSSATSASLHDYVEDVVASARRAPDDRRGAPRRRDRLPRRSCATTPTTRCPGASRRRSRCSTRAARASSCPRSTTATRRGCTPSRSSAGAAELELSPEEAEAVRARWPARCPTRAAAPPLMRVGYLGPAGHVQRGGAARRPPRPAAPSSSRSPRSTTP